MNTLRNTIIALLMLWALPAHAVSGDVNVFLGTKYLDSNDWAAPYDEQGEFGVLFDIRGDNWPVSIAVDMLGSSRTVDYWWGDATVSTSELDLGIRKVFDIDNSTFHPFVGGGLASLHARYEESDATGTWYTEDNGGGIWLNGGVFWTLWGGFNIGLEARYSRGNVTLYDPGLGRNVTLNAGGTHGGLLLGYHW